MNTGSRADQTDHEMEEVLRGAGLETTPEEDRRVLAGAGKHLPRSRWPLVLGLAAAATILVCLAAVYRSPDAGPGTAQPTLVSGAPVTHLADSYAAKPRPGDLAGTTGDSAFQDGVGAGGGTAGGYYVQREAGGGSGGSIRLEGNSPAVGLRGLDAGPVPAAGTGFVRDYDLDVEEVLVLRSKLEAAADLVRAGAWDRDPTGREGRLSPPGEDYDRIIANPWRNPRTAPRSTFSVDVDSASYANVRRFLKEGRLPPADAVRIEEMINYFSYDYPQPEGDRPFAVVAGTAECPWNPKYRLVRIGIQGRRVEQKDVPPRNLVFLLDVSGSMQSEDKLPLVKSAMKLLVGELRPVDRVAIVTYASGTKVVLEPTTGAERLKIIGAIDQLTAGGSTNAGSGIQLAYELARRHFERGAINRVLLATDGDFNVGITDRADLEALITKEREGGIFLTVLGVGTGNLKDSQMEMLADRGNGNYAYLDSILEAQKVLVREAGATLVTIARDVKIQVEFNPARVAAYRLVGYENRLLAARDFNDDTKDAGEIGAGHSVTALYEVIPAGVAVPRPQADPLRYQEPDADAEPEPGVNEKFGEEMLFLRLRSKEPDAAESRLLEFPLTDPGAVSVNETDDDFAFAAAVAVFGKILRNSPDTRELTLGLVEEIAAAAVGTDENGYRREFLELVRTAARLRR
jgi:Ca-activated chloride channel family protein